MATRCMIGFYEKEPQNDCEVFHNHKALIYKHWDGYPTCKDDDGTEHGMIAILKEFLTRFDKARGMGDIEYASARLLQHLCNMSDIPEKEDKYNSNFISFGISKDLNHSDIEFYYAIYPKEIKVYTVQCDYETKTCDLSFSEIAKEEI